jgi:KUP system potassium uptake protein
MKNLLDVNKIQLGGLLITIGIVFGDIGTSPLYVFTAITGGENFDEGLILGSLSCIFWTLAILATFKYIYLALNTDNKGEGGIFALYALLLKTKSKWIIYPALIGCATLISDGFLTPAISVSSAIEGLSLRFPNIQTLPIVAAIIVALFAFQQFGTKVIGKTFGPIMVLWFLMLGTLGIYQIFLNPVVIKAFNPMYAINFIFYYPNGFWLMSAVFLCTTGAEALYSDLGHCGKQNIRFSWAFVASMLLLNYFGQAAMCLSFVEGQTVTSVFYTMVPEMMLPFAISIATLAAVIASQALITGIFTLVNEAMKLNLWVNLKVNYPTDEKGQVYIPFINYFLMFGCLTILFIFKKSTNMEAAYGLAIIIDMIMTSSLLAYILFTKRNWLWSIFGVGLFVTLELILLVSNLAKIPHGGWFPLVTSFMLFALLYLHYRAKKLRSTYSEYVPMSKVIPTLDAVSKDNTVPIYATNLVYLARSNQKNHLDRAIYYSLFRLMPKRAIVYWFIHVNTSDEPKGINTKYYTLIPRKCFYVRITYGFKERHQMESVLDNLRQKLTHKNEVSLKSAFESINLHDIPSDVQYVFLNTKLASLDNLNFMDYFAVKVYRVLKSTGVSVISDYGIDNSKTTKETIPIELNITPDIKQNNMASGKN